MVRLALLACSLPLIALAGCASGGDDRPGAGDGGRHMDAAGDAVAPGDAGPRDGGAGIDAGIDAGEIGVDAGEIDAGAPADGGGGPTDAGGSMDAGGPRDAGGPSDAGGPRDAGAPDAFRRDAGPACGTPPGPCCVGGGCFSPAMCVGGMCRLPVDAGTDAGMSMPDSGPRDAGLARDAGTDAGGPPCGFGPGTPCCLGGLCFPPLRCAAGICTF